MNNHKEPSTGALAEREPTEPVRLAESPRLESPSVDKAPDIPTSEPPEAFDRWLHAQLGRRTAAVSAAALLQACTVWLAHP